MRKITEKKVNIGGTKYIVASDDDYLKQIEKIFEPELTRLLKTLAVGAEIVLDIGANIGCTALLLGSLAKQVFAFEPSPTTFLFLEKNIQRSGMQHVIPLNIGLGSKLGEYSLTFVPSNRAGGFVSNLTQASVGHAVEKIKLELLDAAVKSLNIQRVDFIKIDVEGFEGQVLQGAGRTLASDRPVVLLELNHWCLNAFQRTSVPDFIDQLRALFPLLLAVDGSNYLDLHDENETYMVMYHHILHMRYPNIVAAFHESQLERFKAAYRHG